MQKAKIGISVGLLGAIMYLLGLYGGYVITLVVAGYILLCEDNEWLRKATVKSVVLMFAFTVLSALIYLIPGIVDVLCTIINFFGASLYPELLNRLANVLTTILNMVEKLLFLGLALKALNQGNIPVPVVDQLVEKYM